MNHAVIGAQNMTWLISIPIKPGCQLTNWCIVNIETLLVVATWQLQLRFAKDETHHDRSPSSIMWNIVKPITGWWFGTCFCSIFPYIGNVIIPTDELICFRGVAQPPSRLYQTESNPNHVRSDMSAPSTVDMSWSWHGSKVRWPQGGHRKIPEIAGKYPCCE